MKRWLSIFVGVSALLAIPASAFSYGWYNWYGGGTTSVANSWNGFGYSYASRNWGWGSGAYASAYTNTYPAASQQTSWGWGGASASAYSANGSRWASAQATTYNSPWWWGGGYSNAVAQTNGSPSYATAYAHTDSWFSYRFWIPRSAWYGWVGNYGWYVPVYYNYYYWGWFDGDMGDMALYNNLQYNDGSDPNNWTTLLQDGWKDNGDGTFTHLGSLFSASDLLYEEVMPGHMGYTILGHDGASGTSYDLLMMGKAFEVGGDTDFIEIETTLRIRGDIGQSTVPGPAAVAPWLVFLTLGLIRKARKR